MAEVFKGTPAIVSITISDQEFHSVQYHVAGRDLEVVKDVVFLALSGIPADEVPKKVKKERKPRRTKAEMKEYRSVAEAKKDAPEVAVDDAKKKAWA